MPFVGAIILSSVLILVAVLCCAEGQVPPPQGLPELVSKNLSGGFAGFASATASTGELCSYQKSAEDGSTIFCSTGDAAEAWVTKTVVDKAPLAVFFMDAVSLVNVSCTARSPAPGRVPSAKGHSPPPPEPADADTRALTPGTSPADEKAARCTLRCWWAAASAAVMVIGILLSALQVQELVSQKQKEPSKRPSCSTADPARPSSSSAAPVDDGEFYCAICMETAPGILLSALQVQELVSQKQKEPSKRPSCSTADPARPSSSSAAPVDDGEFYCAICMETAPGILKFSVSSCSHSFCLSCIVQYVAAKLDENVVHIECPDPGCGDGAVEPESCHGIIPSFLLDKWGFLLCESALGAAKRVYCPYRDCSAPLFAGGEAVVLAQCPHCHRLLCARCAVPWHDGVGCKEFQALGEGERGREDIMLRRLAGRRKWQRCPKCQMYVEKSKGCNYIKCRCGYGFCYVCASKVSKFTHYCTKCNG